MIGFRPKPSALFLERPRLLRLLPEEAGYVVWLEAPYGYGKSVLTSQWAEKLEAEGWQVVWLAMVEEDPRPVLAHVLNLPPSTPWPILLDALGREHSVLILEDLEASAYLSPLLKHNPGLVLLASRQPLLDPELPRLMTEGRLVHLKAEQLAFTPEEASNLFSGAPGAQSVWEHTRGWSLPLHLAALTGELPESRALLEGVRAGLSEKEWEEGLFLAALPYLPKAKAKAETLRLVEAGFVQGLEGGYRLHPMAADSLFEFYPQAVRVAFSQQAHRLDALMQGVAFEKVGLHDALANLLEHHPELALHDPQSVLRWDQLPQGIRGRGRLALVGDALCSLGRTTEGLPMLLEAARFASSAEEKVATFRDAVWWLAEGDPEQAKQVVQEAEPLLEQVDPVSAARFLNNVSRIYFQTQEFDTAEALVRRALSLLPLNHPRRWGTLINLGILRWNHLGDLQARIETTEETLAKGREWIVQNVATALLDLGRYKLLLGRREAALDHWQDAAQNATAQPWEGLEAQALQAIHTQHFDVLPSLLNRLQDWERPLSYNRVIAFWALELINQGQVGRALEVLQQAPQSELFLTRGVYALALHRSPQHPQAPEQLGQEPNERDREQALHWYAARYRITRTDSDLDAVLKLTAAGAQILPGLVPLVELPRHRPELASAYPLEQVLQSGWKEAIRLRLGEIPALEVKLLGQVSIRVLGQELNLSQRLRDMLLLLLLAQGREAITEALWPEVEPEKGRNNFYVNLNQLKKVLEPWGVPTFILEDKLSRTRTDLWELERVIQQHDHRTVQQQYAELAPGVDLEAFNQRRESLRQEVIGMGMEAGDEASLEWVLQTEPLHEEAFAKLLKLLIASGRRVSAERRYREFARRLQQELNLEPSPQTQQMLFIK